MTPHDGDPATVRLWSLGDESMIEDGPAADTVTVVSRWGETVVPDAGAAGREALRRMRLGPVTLHNVLGANIPGAVDGTSGDRGGLLTLLDSLGGAVVHALALAADGRSLLSVEPVVPRPLFRPEPVPAGALVRLSRFAVLRPVEDGAMLLEVPGAAFRVRLEQRITHTTVAALAAAVPVEDLAAVVGAPGTVVADLLGFLVASGTVLVAGADGRFAEDDDAGRRNWAPHELFFHEQSRSRQGARPADELSAQFARTPPPLTRPRPAGPRFPLHRPRAEEIGADPTLDALLESDHACPDVSAVELTAEQLGTLLFRAARVRATGRTRLSLPEPGEGLLTTQRPYLSIACLYELEIYVSIGRCVGLAPGTYHYDPLTHVLTLVEDDPQHLATMLDVGRAGAGLPARPAAMLTVTARVERLSWVFFGATYATALKHCGILQGVLYLLGRATGLAVHPIPAEAGGSLDRVPGARWPAEVGVGECVIEVSAPAG